MGKLVHAMSLGDRMLVGASWSCWGWDSLDVGTAALPGWNQSAGGSSTPQSRLFPRL